MSGQATPQEHPGVEIKARREAIDLNREGLAYHSRTSLKTIERIERGESKPQRATAAMIEAALTKLERAAERAAA